VAERGRCLDALALWHLPVTGQSGADLIVAAVPLLILHVSIGVFLSLTWADESEPGHARRRARRPGRDPQRAAGGTVLTGGAAAFVLSRLSPRGVDWW